MRKLRYLGVALIALVGATVVATQAGSRDPGVDPDAVVNLPSQPVLYDSLPDHDPSPGEWFYRSERVIVGEVEDFSIYRAKDSGEVPAAMKAYNHVKKGLHLARWRVRVEEELKGSGPSVVNVISGDYAPIKNNNNRNPWLEKRRYRFYLSQHFLPGNFYFVNLAEDADTPVPSPERGPVVDEPEGDTGD